MRGVFFIATALLNMAFAFVTEVIGLVFRNFNVFFVIEFSFWGVLFKKQSKNPWFPRAAWELIEKRAAFCNAARY